MRLSNIFRAFLPLFVIANSYATPVASASEAVQRPKVALVLSGGGAKGVSHVGVIRYLREVGIPIDMWWVPVWVPSWDVCTRLATVTSR